MPKEKPSKDRQLKLVFSQKEELIPINYPFEKDRHSAHLEGRVREKLERLIGSSDQIEKSELTEGMRQKINDALDWHGFQAKFKKGEIDIVAAPKDDTGEYYTDYR
ncbi:hypothetical protein KAR91_10200 [Candidatus Pacearchaeota archaeon]|nr:hypothetical protein [Candidatus Pacearchaeota archaeon]